MPGKLNIKSIKAYNRREEEQQEAQQKEFERQEEPYKIEAEPDVLNVMGTTSLEGTGYSTFRELVEAKNKKIKDIEERRTQRASGISSLIGHGKTLG